MGEPDPPHARDEKYTTVIDSHVVPRAYLRAWLDDRQLACVHVVTPPPGAPKGFFHPPKLKGVRGIAVRKSLYVRQRPRTGETIHDVEWSLGRGENAFGPVLRDVRDRWPLSRRDKAVLAEFLGFQAVRGPRNLEHIDDVLAGDTGAPTQASAQSDLSSDRGLTVESVPTPARLLSSTPRMTLMMLYGKIATVALGSMHWALVEFRDDLLATSDHPVHLWPVDSSTLRPNTPVFPGPLRIREARLPLARRSR